MQFRLVESLDTLTEGKSKMDLHIYIDDGGRAFIYDGQELIEVDKSKISQKIRGGEGWSKKDDQNDDGDDEMDEIDDGDDEEDGEGDDGDDGDEDEDGDDGDDGEDGEDGEDGGDLKPSKNPSKPHKDLYKKPMKGGGTGAMGKDWEDIDDEGGEFEEIEIGDDEVDFDLSNVGKSLLRKLTDNQAQQHQHEIEVSQRELERKNNPNGAVVSVIKANIKDLITRQLKNRAIVIQKLKDDKHQDYGEDERAVRTEIDDDEQIPNKPLCFVYVDSSGSCWNAETQDVITQCTSAFDEFRDLKDPENSLIDYEFYFFSDDVSKSSSNGGGGTEWGPVMRHIQGNNEYKRVPDNVVIVTDGDLQNQHNFGKFEIPGAVWTICVNRADKYLIDPRFQPQCDLQGHPMQGWTINVKGKKNLK